MNDAGDFKVIRNHNARQITAAIQMLLNIFTQIELYLRGTVWVTLL